MLTNVNSLTNRIYDGLKLAVKTAGGETTEKPCTLFTDDQAFALHSLYSMELCVYFNPFIFNPLICFLHILHNFVTRKECHDALYRLVILCNYIDKHISTWLVLLSVPVQLDRFASIRIPGSRKERPHLPHAKHGSTDWSTPSSTSSSTISQLEELSSKITSEKEILALFEKMMVCRALWLLVSEFLIFFL